MMLNKLILTDERINPEEENIRDDSIERKSSGKVKIDSHHSFTKSSALDPVSNPNSLSPPALSRPQDLDVYESIQGDTNSLLNNSQSDINDYNSSSESIQEFLAYHEFEEPSTSEPDIKSHENQLSESCKLPSDLTIMPKKSEKSLPNQATTKLGIKIANSLTESLNPSRSYRKKSHSHGGAACVNCEIY